MDLFIRNPTSFEIKSDSEGVALTLERNELEKARRGEIREQALQQFIVLKMLAEQEVAEEIGNGFYIPSEIAIQLDADVRDQLELPDPWQGTFRLECEGQTFSENFYMRLLLLRPDGSDAGFYRMDGPLLRLSDTELYLPSEPQWQAIKAVEDHNARRESGEELSETANLLAINTLMQAAGAGLAIDLGPFRDLQIECPDSVGVAMSEQDNGDVVLIPVFGAGEDPDMIGPRLGQIEHKEEGSVRVGDRIIVLDKKRMKAVKEVVENRIVKKEDVQAFIENPGAFLDASLVDLDLGFSVRVKGATRFKLAYFGETEGTDIDWFEKLGKSGELFSGPNGVRKIITNEEELARFRELFEDAVRVGSSEFNVREGVAFRFEDPDDIRNALTEVEERLKEPKPERPSRADGDEDQPKAEEEPVVVDIETADEESPFDGVAVPASWQDVLDKGDIRLDNLKLTPFRYQEDGIRWILGLASGSPSGDAGSQLLGSLLADDMGLGKTFMALAAIEEYYRRCDISGEVQRPVLIVAPLSLLENWKDEVLKVFRDPPFRDVVLLQANADLPRFRVSGAGRETRQGVEAIEGEGEEKLAKIRHSLKFGKNCGPERLDMDKRLVLTTYETLRDYQFSLCRIDWSFVIFDEAQQIKNPNALATRAAKGLKAKFRLVMTGTPVENELRDFWCLFDTARPGVLGAYQNFRSTYVRPILSASPEEKPEVRLKVGRELRENVGGLMLRRLKEDNLEGLPEKTIRVGVETVSQGEVYEPTLKATMSGEQLDRYESVISLTREALGSEETAQGAALRGLHQLRAVSLHPDLLEGGIPSMPSNDREAEKEFRKSGKLENLLAILSGTQKRKEKIIIFCINKNLQSFLQVGLEALYGLPVHIINGDTKAVSKKKDGVTRKRLIRDFEARDGFGIIIMSPVAAGVGLTVIGANNVVHLERHWNPAKESQATDRVYRIGQTRPVNIYVPVLHHPSVASFDVNLAKLLGNKIGLRDAIVTPDVVSEEEMVAAGVFGDGISGAPTPISIDKLANISWQFFEALVAEVLAREHDAETWLTPTNDYGCDVVVLAASGNHRLVQCKHTGSKILKGHKPTNEIAGAKGFFESEFGKKFENLDVYTNAMSFDSDARNTAKAQGVNLEGMKSMKRLLRRHKVTDQDVMRRLNKSRWKPTGASLNE